MARRRGSRISTLVVSFRRRLSLTEGGSSGQLDWDGGSVIPAGTYVITHASDGLRPARPERRLASQRCEGRLSAKQHDEQRAHTHRHVRNIEDGPSVYVHEIDHVPAKHPVR